MVAAVVFGQMVIMFVLMYFGIVMYRRGIVDDHGVDQLSNILLNVCTPLIIINAMNIEYSNEGMILILRTIIVSLGLFIVAAIISKLFFNQEDPIGLFSSIFSNAGFIGIPLVATILGPDYIFILTVFILVSNVVAWTHGIRIMNQNASGSKLSSLLKSGVVLSSIIGILLFVSPFVIPYELAAPIGMVADINTVLAMFVLGSYIAKTNFKDILTNKNTYKTIIFRLLVLPILCILVFSLLPPSYIKIKNVLLVAYAAPIGVISALFSKKYGLNHTYAAGLVSLSTLLSILTIPFILWFAHLVW